MKVWSPPLASSTTTALNDKIFHAPSLAFGLLREFCERYLEVHRVASQILDLYVHTRQKETISDGSACQHPYTVLQTVFKAYLLLQRLQYFISVPRGREIGRSP